MLFRTEIRKIIHDGYQHPIRRRHEQIVFFCLIKQTENSLVLNLNQHSLNYHTVDNKFVSTKSLVRIKIYEQIKQNKFIHTNDLNSETVRIIFHAQ